MEEPRDLSIEQDSNPDRQVEFARLLKEANGGLFPLKRESPLGGRLLLSVRCGGTDLTASVHPDKLLLVDLFDERESETTPIGHYDWEIWSGRRALGNKNRHGHLLSPHEGHVAADRRWSGNGFEIDGRNFLSLAKSLDEMSEIRKRYIKEETDWMEPVYQKKGYGSLLIAVSALALKEQSVAEMVLGDLSPLAIKAWSRFDRGARLAVPTQEVIDHPMSKKILEDFI